ncbi:hypothetical protein PILCRDRAFT_828446 [Piloderma croceum F 1598]|uniref:Uncharacterized protein n=1 Tax=Piloderma croceum (strain F 1598) TaxID=765440 RepID=A0A0C3ENL0_PILCF|nr:hypothetical protein PILCRDRAFT_828446 [Piloderma croceum F 1598]
MAGMRHNEQSLVNSNMEHVPQLKAWVGSGCCGLFCIPKTPLNPFLILQHMRIVLSIEKSAAFTGGARKFDILSTSRYIIDGLCYQMPKHSFSRFAALYCAATLAAIMRRRRRKRDLQIREKNCNVDARSSIISDVQGSQNNVSGSQINGSQYNFNLTVSITISKENMPIAILIFFWRYEFYGDFESKLCRFPSILQAG